MSTYEIFYFEKPKSSVISLIRTPPPQKKRKKKAWLREVLKGTILLLHYIIAHFLITTEPRQVRF